MIGCYMRSQLCWTGGFQQCRVHTYKSDRFILAAIVVFRQPTNPTYCTKFISDDQIQLSQKYVPQTNPVLTCRLPLYPSYFPMTTGLEELLGGLGLDDVLTISQAR
jgi:hypothetical protein